MHWSLKQLWLALGLVVLLVLPSQAQGTDYVETLANGVKVYIQPSFASPTVSVNIFLNVGGFEEKEDTLGISHFFEHLFFRGTPSLSGSQFKRRIEAYGGSTNANTSRDMTHYFINLPREYALEGTKLLADALVNAQLDPEAIDQERNAVLEEYRLGADNPTRMMTDRLYSLAYPDHPYSQPIIGTEENIRRFQQADFIKFRDTFYSPERTTVVIVGDVNPAELLPVVRESFGKFTRPHPRAVLRPGAVLPPAREIQEVQGTKSQNSFVVYGFVGPSVADRPDIYSVDVLSFLMGIGRGSLLKRNLVDKGLALDSGLEFLTQRFPGLIMMYAIVSPGEEQKTKDALNSVIKDLLEGNFTQRDLERARNYLICSYELGAETNSGKADSCGFYAAIDNLDFSKKYLQNINRVTRQDVIGMAQKYLSAPHYTIIMKGHSAKKATSSEEEEAQESKARSRSSSGSERPGDWTRRH